MKNNFEIYADVNRSEMLNFVPVEATKILDVGCSVGVFGKTLKDERSAEVWGIELDENAAEIASSRLDKVICCSFESGTQLNSKFDCIVFNDVLEHMVDPYSALEYSKELLTKDGVIVASVPNVRFFDNIWGLIIHKNWEYQDAGILDRTHLRFFTKRSIIKMFQDAGLTIDRIEGINPIESQRSYLHFRYKVLNFLMFNRIEDMRWLQFAIVARPTQVR